MEPTLIDRIKSGDRDAAEKLIRQHYTDIYRYMCRRTISRQTAEDLTQTVFLRFLESVDAYREQGRLRAYLFRIALNACRDHYRKNGTDQEPLNEENAPSSPAAHLSVEQAERAAAIRRLMGDLPEKQREAVVLRVYHELSFKEIAAALGCTLPTAKSRFRQGLMKVKRKLEQEGIDL